MTKRTKTAVLALRISNEEQDRIKEAADARGQNVSEYVRGVVMATVSPGTRRGHKVASTSAATNLAEAGDHVTWQVPVQQAITVSDQSITVSKPRLPRR